MSTNAKALICLASWILVVIIAVPLFINSALGHSEALKDTADVMIAVMVLVTIGLNVFVLTRVPRDRQPPGE